MKRPVKPGEVLAIDPRAVQRDADSIFVLFSPKAPENEYACGVACVHIRGGLDHHGGFGDNYDDIKQRAREAFECEEAQAVIFRIDSPGGAVSGLFDTARAIRGMAEESGKPTVAYVDEHAFSAAYALACACDRIVLPPSGLAGSIGAISTMATQFRKDKAEGYDFVTITSGERKADGHIHAPISEEAVAVEQERVDEMALQFFQLVRESRGLSIKTIRGFQAGIFLGQQAVDVGVADEVSSFDELFASLAQSEPLDTPGTSGTPSTGTSHGGSMKAFRAQLLEQLKAAKAQLAAAKGTDKLKAEVRVETLSAQLEAYKKVTEKHVEHSKTHEEDEGDEDEEGNETDRGDDEEGDEEKDDKKASGSKSTPKAAAGKSKARMAEEEDDEEEARYEDDEEEALAAIVQRAKGKSGSAARGALAGMQAKVRDADKLAARVAKLEQEKLEEKRGALIQSALDAKRITAAEAKALRGEDMSYCKAFLAARPKSLVWTSADQMPVPQALPGGQAALTPELEQQIQQAMVATGLTREQIVKGFESETSKLNGKGGVL